MPREGGASSTPRPIVSIIDVSGILDHPPARVMTIQNDSAFSRREAPEVLHENCSLEKEGAGNAGCTLHPRSRVQNAQKETHTSIQVQRRHSGIPCAVALRLMPCSPRRRIRLVTVAAGLMALPIRLDRTHHRQLGTSNGCRDHTVLPYAECVVRLRAVARSRKTALRTHLRADAKASTAFLPHVRDDARPPLLPGKDGASW
jgi:hypothetical protein